MGGKGSGRVRTPADRAQRASAGRASGRARAKQKLDQAQAAAAQRARDRERDEEDDERKPTDQTLPTKRHASLADYDRVLGKPVTWTEAKKREEVQGEIIANEGRRDAQQVARAKLFTREQIDQRDKRVDDAIVQGLAELPDLAASLVEPDKKDAARGRLKDWVAEFRRRLAEAVKA